MFNYEVSKSPTVHLEDEVLEKLEAIRLEVIQTKIRERKRGSTSYNEVIKRLIKFREQRNANDI